MLPVFLATLAADILFWGASPGISVGLMTLVLAALALAVGKLSWSPRLAVILGALLACVWQSVVEISLSNVLASLVFLLALVGEGFMPAGASLWAKISDAAFGVALAPFSWLSVLKWTAVSGFQNRESLARGPGAVARLIRAILPALILVIIFAGFFSAGNAIFAEFGSRFFNWIGNILRQIDLSPLRVIFWGFVATLALGLFRGRAFPGFPRFWVREAKRFRTNDAKTGLLQSGCTLGALNLLFCIVNTIDVIYLWRRGTVPVGVDAKQYLHSGVNSLITVVVLSAIVIAWIMQQADEIANTRWLKNLAHLWIAQNYILIAGVFLRLKLYVDLELLTETRVYVACFLLLVCTGFAWLAWFVEKRPPLNWLLGRNAFCTVLLFFILQFLNVDSFVARSNVLQWERGGTTPYVQNLSRLGPGAWEWLARLAHNPNGRSLANEARTELKKIKKDEQPLRKDWHAYQLRKAQAYHFLD